MFMPGRKYNAGSGYRYGFNGKENDNEVAGEGNIYDYGFRIYNPLLGRFLSVDPLTNSYPWYTPYQFAGNMPIIAIDLDGLEEYIVITKLNKDGGKTVTIEYVTQKGSKKPVNIQYKQVMKRDASGDVSETGDPMTGKRIVRIVQDINGNETSPIFGNKLTDIENKVLKNQVSSSSLFPGDDEGENWEITINKKDYISTIKRNHKKHIENSAEVNFGPPVKKEILLSGAPAPIVSNNNDNGNLMWNISANTNNDYPQQLNKYLSQIQEDGTVKSIVVNMVFDIGVNSSGVTGDMTSYVEAGKVKIINQVVNYFSQHTGVNAANIKVDIKVEKHDFNVSTDNTTTQIKVKK